MADLLNGPTAIKLHQDLCRFREGRAIETALSMKLNESTKLMFMGSKLEH
jgi:hypothetical protein